MYVLIDGDLVQVVEHACKRLGEETVRVIDGNPLELYQTRYHKVDESTCVLRRVERLHDGIDCEEAVVFEIHGLAPLNEAATLVVAYEIGGDLSELPLRLQSARSSGTPISHPGSNLLRTNAERGVERELLAHASLCVRRRL